VNYYWVARVRFVVLRVRFLSIVHLTGYYNDIKM